jgi:hypothetical protein
LLPANAPQWGGFYERLNHTLKQMFLSTFPQLQFKSPLHIQSALKQIECRMNKRPLWAISMDRDDPEMICPANFLVVAPEGNFGPPGRQTIDQLKSFCVTQQGKIEQMWSTFFTNYIAALRVQKRWNYKKGPDLKVGDFVVLHHKYVAKTRWPLARIRSIKTDGTYGRIKSVYVDTYVADKVNTKLKNQLFGVRTTHAHLTPTQYQQVRGFFRPLERPVPIDRVFPYEMFGDLPPAAGQLPTVQQATVGACWNTDEYVLANLVLSQKSRNFFPPIRTVPISRSCCSFLREYY